MWELQGLFLSLPDISPQEPWDCPAYGIRLFLNVSSEDSNSGLSACVTSALPTEPTHLFPFLYTRSRVLHLITLWAQRWCMMQETLSKEVAIIVRKHSEMPTFSITFFTLKSHFLSWWVASIGKCACQKPDMLSWSPEQHKHKKNELTPQIF